MSRILALTFVALAAPVSRAADPLDATFAEKAKSLLGAAKKKGLTNLGVVKFLVRHGDGPLQDDVGDLNLTLANKAEVALILANTDDKFGIIDRASEVVVKEKLFTANHRTEDGRRAFFARKYELAWSRAKVEPAGFLTGVATFSQDLTKFAVRFQLFDKSGKLVDLPDEVSVAAAPELLAQAGYSYALAMTRQKAIVTGGPLPTGDELRGEVVGRATNPAAEKPGAEPFAPLADSPIKWTVLYNGKAVAVTGNAVPEPKENDRVEFTLSNPGSGTYAVVLLVNGANTLYEERGSPQACRKWVLEPNTSVTIRGFQTGPDVVVPFKVLPPDEVPADVVDYGEHAGTFRMVVFHGKMRAASAEPTVIVAKNREDATVLALARTRGNTRPDGVKPQTLRALQADLRGRLGGDGARGYVVKGNAADKFETTAVEFVASPEIPVADVSLRYFTPKK